jgi:leucyl-tRNA synthetase
MARLTHMAHMAKETYNHSEIEKAAQEKWAALDLYKADLNDTEKDPYYLLVEFPYPSGDLHTGHWYAYAMPDIYARYLRMQGKNVLFPFGFDAFGLPAENAAIKRGLDPKEWTYSNMDNMRTQIKRMGASFDWSKEVVTCEPEYYKWTQWLFSKLYEHKLAERREAPVKWCPVDLTVLANEQVINGHCERCGSEVEEKILTQWFLKITQYAKRLLTDLDPLPWREEIKDAQRAWIGESEGARLAFPLKDVTLEDLDVSIEVFTTRPDTIYGVTYIVLAPEHPLLDSLMPAVLNAGEVEAYKYETKKKTERERSENKQKTGVKLEGIHAYNPATLDVIPVYIADYVLASYGTGAVMAVPAHDERDFEFAKKYELPIIDVIIPQVVDHTNPHVPGKKVVTREATINIVYNPKTKKYLCLKWKQQGWTTFITGGVEEGEDALESGKREILEETGYKNMKLIRELGKTQSQFFAAHKDVNRIANNTIFLFELEDEERDEVDSAELSQHEPVWLTDAEIVAAKLQHAEFSFIWDRITTGTGLYTGDGILMRSGVFDGRDNREVMADIVQSIGGERVTNYRIRDWLVSRQRYWGCPIPVVYDPEGMPHLVPADHLPWLLPTDVDFTPTDKSPLATSKELHERVERIFGEGWTPEYDTLDVFVDSSWYYARYLDAHNEADFSSQKLMKQWMPVDRYSGGSEHTTMHLLYARFFNKALYDLALVPAPEPFMERFNRGIILGPDGQKMSKSKGNVINPDELVQKFGADAVRMYLAFIGPYNEAGSYPWNLSGVESMRKFLDRIYYLSAKVRDIQPSEEFVVALGKASAKVATDIERFKFNTAISALMILVRDLEAFSEIPRASYEGLLVLLAPFAPHLAESLWGSVESTESVHQAHWPEIVEIEEELATVIVQINSKKKGEITLPKEATEEEALALAREIVAVQTHLSEVPDVRVIYVPGRILNFVGV